MKKKISGQKRESRPSGEHGTEQVKKELPIGKVPRGRVVAGALSLAILAGGSALIWKQYQANGLFHPEYFLSRKELRGNQLSFSDSDRYAKNHLPEQDTSDSEMLEKDPQAQEKTGQEMEDISPRVTVDEMKKEISDLGNLLVEQMPDYAAADASGRNLPDLNGSGAVMLVPDGQNSTQTDHISVGSVAAGGAADTRAEAGFDSGAGTGLTGKTENESGKNSSSGSSSGGNSGSGSGSGDSSNPSSPDSPKPSNPSKPSSPDSPAPDPAPAPDNNPTEGKDSDLSDPDYPEKSDKPQLPKDPFLDGDVVYPSFPDSGISSDEKAQNAKLVLLPCLDESAETLYQGAVLTKWKLLCSLYAYAEVDGVRYRLTDYNDNFRIGEFPETAGENLTVSFYFRGNANCPWQEVSYEFPVEYSKVVLMGMPDENGNRQVLKSEFADKGKEIFLPTETMTLAGLENWESVGDWMTQLFPQWSLTEDGEDMGSYFKIEKPGRYVLYPLERTPLPTGFFGMFDVNDDRATGSIFLEQKLTFWPSGLERLEIPQGIHGVQQSLFFIASDVAETAWIPESVQFVDSPAFEVRKEYQVSEDNRYFTAEDGMLIDKEKKELIGIPIEKEDVEVPAWIETVDLSEKNSIKQITFLSEEPPEIDLSDLSNAVILVPESAYPKYLFAWGSMLGSNQLVTGGEDVPDYDYQDGALLSKDGKKLYQVSKTVSGLYFVPDGVETIGTRAFETAEYVERVYVPESVTTLESESLGAENLRELYFMPETPPEIQADTFGDLESALDRGFRVFVSAGSRETYLASWGEILGEELAERLISDEPFDMETTESGLSYLNLSDGAVLLKAPEDLTSFDDIVAEAGEEIVWKEIGTRAFGKCELLESIVLPETIEKIGKEAFAQCTSLQIAVSKTKDSLEVGKNAFPAMRAAAFDAMELKFSDDEENMLHTSCFVNNDAEVSGGTISVLVNKWGTSYELLPADQTGSFLYGTDGEDAYLISGTEGVSGEILSPEGTLLREIGYYALENCDGDLTLPEESSRSLWFIGTSAFENSGLSGSVAFSDALWKIEAMAFQNCEGITEIRFDAEADPAWIWQALEEDTLGIGEQAFSGTSITEISFPERLTELGQFVFNECRSLEKVGFSGETPPTLITYTRGNQYEFGWESQEDQSVSIVLEGSAEGCGQEYLDKWRFSMLGYDSKEDMAESMKFDLLMDVMFDWPGEIWGDDGEYTPEFEAYFEAYVDQKVNLKIYDAELLICELLGLDPPEAPDDTPLDPGDFMTDETDTEIPSLDGLEMKDLEIKDLENQEEIKKEEEITDLDGNTDSSEEIEDSDSEDSKDSGTSEDSKDSDNSKDSGDSGESGDPENPEDSEKPEESETPGEPEKPEDSGEDGEKKEPEKPADEEVSESESSSGGSESDADTDNQPEQPEAGDDGDRRTEETEADGNTEEETEKEDTGQSGDHKENDQRDQGDEIEETEGEGQS